MFFDIFTDTGDSFLRNAYRISPHVGYQADRLTTNFDTFVKILSNAHSFFRRVAKTARGFLLQGAGRERWRGWFGDFFLFDIADLIGSIFQNR